LHPPAAPSFHPPQIAFARSNACPNAIALLQLTAKPALLLLSRMPRRAWRWVIRIAVVAALLPLLLQWVIAYIVGDDARLLPPQLLSARNLLIVTAHPDDECLFFAPSIIGVLDRNKAITGGLLVMSTGRVIIPLLGVSRLLIASRQQLWDWRSQERGASGVLQDPGH
jgi:hypothetical protein